MTLELEANIPHGRIEDKWATHLDQIRLVGPRNRPKYTVIVVGTGLAGAAAIESQTGIGLWELVSRFGDGKVRLHDVAVIITEGIKGAGAQTSRAKVAEMIWERGIAVVMPLACAFLLTVLAPADDDPDADGEPDA